MANPSISGGISQRTLSAGATWNSGTLAAADGPIDANDLSLPNNPGVDPSNTCQTFENSNGPSTTNNLWYSAYSPSFTAVDISSSSQALCIHLSGNSPQFNRVKSVRLYALNSTRTNGKYWDIGAIAQDAVFYPILLFNAGGIDSGGTSFGSWDASDVVEVGFAWQADGGGNFGVDVRISQVVHVDGAVVFADGDATTPGTFERYYDLLKPTSGQTYHSKLNAQLRPAYGFGHGVRLNCERLIDAGGTFVVLPDGLTSNYEARDDYAELLIDPSSGTAQHDLTDYVFTGGGRLYNLTIDGSAAAINHTRVSFLETRDVIISGASYVMDNVSIPSPGVVDISDAGGSISIDDCTAPVTISDQLQSGASVTITNPQGVALQFDFDGADDSGREYTVPGGATINMNPATTDSYTLTGITASSTVTFDNLTANNITIDISGSLSAVSASPTTGGGTITFNVPAVQYTAQTSGARANSRIQVFNVTTSTEIANDTYASDWSLLYTNGNEFTNGDTVRIRVTYANGTDYSEPLETVLIVNNGFTALINQSDWLAVESLGIDGSTVTEFSTDFTNLQVDIDDGDGNTTKQRLVAWYAYSLWSSAGAYPLNAINLFFGGLDVEDSANYKVITSIVDLKIENVGSNTVIFTDTDTRLYTDDGSNVIAPTSNSIHMESGKVYTIETGISGLTPAESNQLAQAAEAQAVNTKIGTPSVTVSDDVAAIPVPPTAAQNADAMLDRNLAGGSDGGRTVRDALRSNRNRVEVDADGGTITVYEEDDATAAWTGTVTTGQRDPINEVDPS